jgi:hypothetical protein
VVVASDLTGDVHAVDTASGKELWRFPMGDRAFGGILLANGAVFAAADNGLLYALDTDSAAPPAPTRRIVYAEGKGEPEAAGWFSDDLNLGILRAFKNAGYEKLTGEGLTVAMKEQIDGNAPSVVVFADQHVPAAVSDASNGPPLIRRYLDAGGAVVFLGTNPLALGFDPATGALANIDEAAGGAMLDLAYPRRPEDYGYHVSNYTGEGERFGLSGYFVTNGAIRADQVTTVLAHDRIGFATAWLKSYGTRGGMLLQLALPRNRLADYAPFRAAVEVALARRTH